MAIKKKIYKNMRKNTNKKSNKNSKKNKKNTLKKYKRYNKSGGRRKKQRKTIKTKKLKKESCAPTKSKKKSDYTCYSDSNLRRLRELWNVRHPDKPIHETSPKKIWSNLNYAMENVCDKESCWFDKQMNGINDFDMKKFKSDFAPKKPDSWSDKPDTWLNSTDILNVMKQYEDAYPTFEFIGPSPIDFDDHHHNGECVWKELCEFDLETHLKKNKKKVGVVFNLDPHYKSGSHWVAMFINSDKKEVCYFDSYGEDPPKEIRKLGKRILKQSTELSEKFNNFKGFKFKVCSKRHQYSNSECGVYSLYFIIELLKGNKNSSFFSKTRIPDDYVKKFRDIYFNDFSG